MPTSDSQQKHRDRRDSKSNNFSVRTEEFEREKNSPFGIGGGREKEVGGADFWAHRSISPENRQKKRKVRKKVERGSKGTKKRTWEKGGSKKITKYQ